MSDWTDRAATKTYARRVENLFRGTGCNGSIVLTSQTVLQDDSEDVMTGSNGED